ncbi:hypothetical protein JXM67_14195 [candidate division WOR-3 bacterium]|nr:hypothetical protein [candidate division WOR-3 bacterium]
MRKPYTLAIAFIAGMALFFTACEEDDGGEYQPGEITTYQEHPPVKNLTYEVVDDLEGDPGGGIYLTWDSPDGATPEEYVVSIDGIDQTPTEVTEDYVYTPAAKIEVYAVYTDGRSTPKALEFKAVETELLEVWSSKDPSPDHPSGLGFGSSGFAASYAMSFPQNWPFIDYYVDTTVSLASPDLRTPEPMNDEHNTSCSQTGTYEKLNVVKPCGGVYHDRTGIVKSDLYGLWLDENDNGYTSDDHFAKAYVIDVQGLKVTLKLAYQRTPGLRWVITEEEKVGIEED